MARGPPAQPLCETSPLRTSLLQPSPLSPASSVSSPSHIFLSTDKHILISSILRTYPWPRISLPRTPRGPPFFKFLVRVIFAVPAFFFSNFLFNHSSPAFVPTISRKQLLSRSLITSKMSKAQVMSTPDWHSQFLTQPLRAVLFSWLPPQHWCLAFAPLHQSLPHLLCWISLYWPTSKRAIAQDTGWATSRYPNTHSLGDLSPSESFKYYL